jgi:hypothetical protein
MKRKTLLFEAGLLFGLLWAAMIARPCLSGQAEPGQAAQTAGQEHASNRPRLVIKTYSLKHIQPGEFLRAARLFFDDASFSGNTVTVKI